MNIEWTKDLEIGEKEIDSQHYKLVQQFNLLWAAVSYGVKPEKIVQIIDFLDDYIMIHFNYEENQMIIHHHPGYELHKEKHRDFIRQYIDLKEKLTANGPSTEFITQTVSFLHNWLNVHIANTDQELAVYYQKDECG